MSFGSTPDTLMYELIFVLAAIPVALVLLALGNLLRRLVGVSSAWVGLVIIVLPLASVIIGTSLYLDRTGVIVPGQVLKKTETIHFREEGDWQHNYAVQVQYTTAEGATPAARFTTTATIFDALQEGGNTQVRTVSINGWFNLVRLADQSTWTWIPWRWLAIGVSVLVLAWLGWQFLQNKIGCALLLVIALIIFITPFVLKFNEWQRSENITLTPLRANGVITEIEGVTEIDPLPGDGSGEGWETAIEVAQPYDIVVVRYTPQGYADPVLGVDAIDADSQALAPEMRIEIAYASTDPRAVRLRQGTRSHHWKNPVEWLKQQALGVLVILALIGAGNWISRRWQRLLESRKQPSKQP